ncbi:MULTISPECIES: hypothetical protein [Pseudomonas]|uniref:hypothetical protein n=1 Tax=Pseudomonas TaxID=286 RepID=UPI001268F120|nr:MULTISPECIES: hypothetical protein [Pseudomonas]NWD99675.1 hypothetical protein [Pseudomonas sp. IPO3749]NWF21382.1 hypothetical protein [Pseudomonas sp. IPO3749]
MSSSISNRTLLGLIFYKWSFQKVEIGDLKKLNISLSANLAIFFFSFIAPGFLIFYKYEPEAFISIDVSKLIILAIAISSPTFIFPLVLTALFANLIAEDMPDKRYLWGTPTDWYLKHGAGNALNMYTIIGVLWIFDLGGSWVFWLILLNVVLNLIVESLSFKIFLKSPSSKNSIWFENLSTQRPVDRNTE